MKNLIVHTRVNLSTWHVDCRFQKEYDNKNTDRLTIVGIPNEETKELSVGIAFCTYPDNFSRATGTSVATLRAAGTSKMSDYSKTKPYAVIPITEVEFTMEACLNVLYAIHDELIKLSVKEVKRLVNQQIVK